MKSFEERNSFDDVVDCGTEVETSAPNDGRTILLVGKVGHGKTFLLNKVCGTIYPSEMCASSCTRGIQRGCTARYGINVIDTPGFYSSEEIDSHTTSQRKAIEQNVLSGIYIVVKFGRADEMVETTNKILNFVGDDGIRIIITHVDSDDGTSHVSESINRLSELVDVHIENIIAVGNNTDPEVIENFMMATLDGPQKYEVTEVQLASVADLSVGARRFKRTIDEVKGKIEAAERACQGLLKVAESTERAWVHEKTLLETEEMVRLSKTLLFRDAEELTVEQRNALERQWLFSISRPLTSLMEARSKYFPSHWYQGPLLEVSFAEVEDAHSWCVKFKVDGVDLAEVEQVPGKLLEAKRSIRKHALADRARKCRRKNKKKKTAAQPPNEYHSDTPTLIISNLDFKHCQGKDIDAKSFDFHEPAGPSPEDQALTRNHVSLGDESSNYSSNPHDEPRDGTSLLDGEDDMYKTWCDLLVWFASVACCCVAICKARSDES